jgi:hypothetical protein
MSFRRGRRFGSIGRFAHPDDLAHGHLDLSVWEELCRQAPLEDLDLT